MVLVIVITTIMMIRTQTYTMLKVIAMTAMMITILNNTNNDNQALLKPHLSL